MNSSTPVNPEDFVITRRRKKYKFALFHNSPICFELTEWDASYVPDVIEIGAGTGFFSIEQARQHLENRFLAVDVKADRLQKGATMVTDQALSNMRFLRARADQLPEILLAHAASIIWVTFPDPFPRKHSAGRRLMHPKFLKVYKELLKKDGALYFKTDAHALFDWSLEQLVNEGWAIEELSFDLHDSKLPEWYKVQTNYEKRFIGEGLKISFVKATPPK